MRLLITRPVVDAEPLAQELTQLGHEVLIEPLLKVHFHPLQINPSCYRAFLATSANGIRAVARLPELSGLQYLEMFAVGPASAREAEKTGFEKIHVAGGDVAALATRVAEALPTQGKPLLHVSGAAAAGDLKGDLESRGFSVDHMVGYEARARETFSKAVHEGLAAGCFKGVLLYSPRTAVIFNRILRSAGLEQKIPHLHFFCLSQAVADKLQDLDEIKAVVAASPDQTALLKLIAEHA